MNDENKSAVKRIGLGFAIVFAIVMVIAVAAFAQWGPQNGYWQMGPQAWQANCPPGACSIQGSVLNLPGTSAKSQLLANSAGSSTASLVNTGISFPLAANENGTLNCEIYFTNGNGGGLSLGLNGPASPTEVTLAAQIQTGATAVALFNSQSAAWQAVLNGASTSTTTTQQLAELSAGIENGPNAGTLNVQFSDVNTTGSTVILRGSWCSFP